MKNCAYKWLTGHSGSSLKKTDLLKSCTASYLKCFAWASYLTVCVCVHLRHSCVWLPLHPQLSGCREQLTPPATCYDSATRDWQDRVNHVPTENRRLNIILLLFTYSTLRSLGRVTFENIKKETSTGKGVGRGVSTQICTGMYST